MPMLRLFAKMSVLGSIGLCACTAMPEIEKPQPILYDVRGAVVVAPPDVPKDLLPAINDRVNAAIAATTPPGPLPKVVLTIHVQRVLKARGFNTDRNIADVSVEITSADTGSVIAVNSFESTTFAPNSKVSDDLVAETVAARIRAIFGLKIPNMDSAPAPAHAAMNASNAMPTSPQGTTMPTQQAPSLPQTSAPVSAHPAGLPASAAPM